MSKQFYAEIFQTRLKEAIAPENLKQWCQRVGIPLSTITGAAQRKTVPGGSTLLELSKLTGRSIDWLLGISSTLAETNGVITDYGIGYSGALLNTSDSIASPVASDMTGRDCAEFVKIPVYPMSASLHLGTETRQDNAKYYLTFRRDFIKNSLHITHNHLFCIEVDGISMEPLLRKDLPILIEAHSDQPLQEGPHLLRLEGALLIKHLQRIPGSRLRLWSEATRQPVLETHWPSQENNGLEILGRVRWSYNIF